MAVIAADVLVDRRDGTEAERTVFFDVKCSMALEKRYLQVVEYRRWCVLDTHS